MLRTRSTRKEEAGDVAGLTTDVGWLAAGDKVENIIEGTRSRPDQHARHEGQHIDMR